MPLFQYQAKAEPLRPLVVTETITADKWQGERPDLNPRRVPLVVALMVAGMVGPVLPPPAVTVDQWDGYQQEAVRVVKPRQAGCYAVDPVLVPVRVDEWIGSATVPPRAPAPRMAGAFTVEPSPLRTVAVGDWQGFDDYRRPTPRPDLRPWYAGPTTLVASTEVITLDKWLWTWPQPDRTRHPINPASGGKLPDRASPTPDLTWYAPASQPAPLVKPRPITGSVDVPGVVAIDWQGIQAQPVARQRRQVPSGSVAPVYVPVVAVDNGPMAWHMPTSQPVRGRSIPWLAESQFVIAPVLTETPAPTITGYLVLQTATGVLILSVLDS